MPSRPVSVGILGGLLGGGALLRFVPDLPTLAAAGTLTAINSIMGVSGFAVQFALTALLPSGVSFSVATIGTALAPVIAGMGVMITILVTAARRRP